MANVDLACVKSGLFFLSAFKLLETPAKIESSLTYMFSEIFTDPILDWNKIRRVFETFGTSSIVANASLSKNTDIGDGVKTAWKLNGISVGTLVQCYNIADSLGILADSTASQITFTAEPSEQEVINRKKWQALATQYEILKGSHTTQVMLSYGVSEFINSEGTGLAQSQGTLYRSPQQLQMYYSYLAKTSIPASPQVGAVNTESVIYKCPFDSSKAVFSDLVDVLRNDWWTELPTLNTINVQYTDTTAIHIVDSTALVDGFIEFDHYDYVAHLKSAVVLPSDDPSTDATADVSVTLKMCYGLEYGDSRTWDCDTCYYANNCKNAEFINPYNMDSFIQNKLWIKQGPPWVDNVNVTGNQRIRIIYKRIEVL